MKKLCAIFVCFSFLAICFSSGLEPGANDSNKIMEFIPENAPAASTPYDGFTLFSPGGSNVTYLIDINGEVVHTWPSEYYPGMATYMKPNGNIVKAVNRDTLITGGGGVQEIAWNGTLLWDYEYQGEGYIQHHDIALMPNGNVLILVWENKTGAEAIAAGRNPAYIDGSGIIQVEYVVEVRPTGPTTGDIVWEWHAWDHLIQDFDNTKANYGMIADHPELMDINYPPAARVDWLHGNGLDYNPDLDQVIISCRSVDELWIIDHSTSTAESGSHSGGLRNKGGDIIYRWGNPMVYGAGTLDDKQLFGQHDASWIEPGCPGEGNILIFNNGGNRPVEQYSTVDEIMPPIDVYGNYSLISGTAYGPAAPVWNYTAYPPTDFFAAATSGAQRLSNGNTMITHGPDGYIFEVNSAGDLIWEYQNEYPPSKAKEKSIFKSRRYTNLTIDLPLSEGWNLVSLPFIPQDSSLDTVLSNIDGEWDKIYAYDALDSEPWKSNRTSVSYSSNELDAMDHRTGFWINITVTSTALEVSGKIAHNTTIPLYTGWNLVGYPTLTEKSISDSLFGTTYDAVEGFNVASPYLMTTLPDTYIMKPGEAYWIHVTSDCTWTVC